ncbi:hypothetical protein I316_00330 [Kwoniella heveanensis BCC8398]|uniref:Uncharacterized protein n=1 Tax=Kwoniella heveanensis BCC8398 TaxID=1296120 RepID=A0A1B9H4B1_9TREE|nr:hypothetical protein I316_00330 [Kwoniella heveanensis BCC8398]
MAETTSQAARGQEHDPSSEVTDNINRRQAGSSAASAPTVQSGFPEASGITSPSAVYNVTRATRTTTGDMTVPIGTEDPLFGQASPDRSSDIAYGSPGSQIVGYRTARGEAMEMVPVSSRGGHFADTNTIPRSGTTLTYSHRAYEDGDPNDTCTCPETCDECTKSCFGICETCLTGVKRCAMGKEGNDVSRTCRRKTWGIAGALGLVVLASGLAIKYGGNDDSGSNSNSGQ